MRTWLLQFALASVYAVAAFAQPGAPPTKVELAQGALIADSESVVGIEIFKGIPYALPPIGELRWKPAQPPVKWADTRRADRFGPDCVQSSTMTKTDHPAADFFYQPPAVTSEDCLYLNLWRPSDRTQKLPVMVWIHGGGSVQGSGAHPLYDGAQLAKKGVVVVTFNYRLGIFGRFAHLELSAESERGASGNYDLSDILQALRWIKQNIGSFGGDPDRITIFGESSGGGYVSALTVMPSASALFHGAIAQSGSVFYRTYLTLREAEAAGMEFGQAVGLPAIRMLRAVPADTLQLLARSMPYSPTLNVDGYLMPRQPCQALQRGDVARVPIIAGSNGAELFRTDFFEGIGSASDYEQRVRQVFGPNASSIFKMYPAGAWKESVKALRDYGMSAAMAENIAHAAEPRAYLYRFNQSPDGIAPAFHTAEIGFVFNNISLRARYSQNMPPISADASNTGLADVLSDYWVAFARTGRPEADGQTRWLSYERARGRNYMEFQGGQAVARSKFHVASTHDLCRSH